jgi:hypothetical protein
MNNARNELDRAIWILATSTKPLQERLSDAWVKLDSHNLTGKRDSGESNGGKVDSLTRELLADEGTIEAAFSRMNKEDCEMWIHHILDLYRESLSAARSTALP